MYRVKNTTISLVFLAGLTALSACKTTSNANMDDTWSNVTAQQWQLVQVTQSKNNSSPLVPTPPVMATAQFSPEGTVSGNAGCNQYSGNYTQAGTSLDVLQLATTRKMCLDEHAMKIEDALTGAFVLVDQWDLVNGHLVLSDQDGDKLIEFAPAAP